MQVHAAECGNTVLADHLIALPQKRWAFWKCAGLRGSGFPVSRILQLAASQDLCHAADSVLVAEQKVKNARIAALQEVNRALDQLRSDNQWNDRARRAPLVALLRKLQMMETRKLSVHSHDAARVKDLTQALHEMEMEKMHFQTEFESFSAQKARVLHNIAEWPLFREAVTWQNRMAAHTALNLVRKARGEGLATSKRKEHEELVARYLQRYCTKNDTIGFFGPVAWAEFVPSGKTLTAIPGSDLLATRQVYFETWAIEALAKTLTRDINIYPWLMPIRMPFIRVEGTLLHHPVYGYIRLCAEQAEVLQACDGLTTAKEIVRCLLQNSRAIHDEAQFYKTLAALVQKSMVFWNFNVPFEAHPERSLRAALEAIDDETLRLSSMDMLDQMEAARDLVASSTGDPERLDEALAALEQTFTRITGISAVREEGKTYAGRTIVYEDCRRDIHVELGPQLLQSLADPLSLILESARWLTWEVAALYQKKLREIYDELVRTSSGKPIDLARLWIGVMPFLFGSGRSIIDPVRQEFFEKWERVLELPPGTQPVTYSSKDLREKIAREFPAPRAGWINARYHTPDIMIAAPSQEAIQAGDYLLVMGEMHVGANTLEVSVFVNQHPSPESLISAHERDLEGLNVMPVLTKGNPGMLGRTSVALVSSNHFQLEYGIDGFTNDRSKALPVSSFFVKDENGELIATTHDGKVRFTFIDVVGRLLTGLVLNSFRMLEARPHTPRIVIDRLVIKRESWRLSPSGMAFVQEKSSAERFLGARRWARSNGIPRFVFFKIPIEKKPAYLDLDSPSFVDIFCKMVRRTLAANLPDPCVELTEMLPTLENVWLRDAADQQFTSEFRIVAVDLSR